MAATTRVTRLCACVRYWPYRGDGVVCFLAVIVCFTLEAEAKFTRKFSGRKNSPSRDNLSLNKVRIQSSIEKHL